MYVDDFGTHYLFIDKLYLSTSQYITFNFMTLIQMIQTKEN